MNVDAPISNLTVSILPDGNSVHAKTFIKDEVEDACNWITDHQRTGRNIYFQRTKRQTTASANPARPTWWP
jgi:hypothetical protein